MLRWTTSNATSCTGSNGSNNWSGTKSATGGTFNTGLLTNTTSYNITCTNSTGSASDSVTVSVGNQQPQTCQDVNATNYGGSLPCTYITTRVPVVNLTAVPNSVQYGDSSYIYWNPTNNPTSCIASNGYSSNWSGSKSTTGGSFYTGPLYSTTIFTMTCSNSAGSASESVSVNVSTINQNNQLYVTTFNATNVTTTSATLNGLISNTTTGSYGNNYNSGYTTAWFTYGTNTNFGYTTTQTSYNSGSSNYSAFVSNLSPNTTYYFRAVAQNSQGIVYGNTLSFTTGTTYISNPQPVNQPTVVLSADQTNLAYNGTTTIRWYTSNATSCVASDGSIGWTGNQSIGPGSFYTGSLTRTTTYTMTCSNGYSSATDSVTVSVRGQTIVVNGPAPTRPAPTSLVLITSSVDRNQPIVPTIDNTRPHPGDEINYTVTYQNIGNASITNLTLRIVLPLEVDYITSVPTNPIISGNTLVFNLGTLRANGQGTVSVRVRVRQDAPLGTFLNFPATLSYIDPSGYPQTVEANVSAQVWSQGNTNNLGATAFLSGISLSGGLLGLLVLIILILLIILLVKYLLDRSPRQNTTILH